MKLAKFLGDSKAVIGSFPEEARQEAGFQIEQVQRGLDPDDWKPMKTIGTGVREIRIREAFGAFRVIYTAALADYVYVLHAFQKKTQTTSKRDIDLAKIRFKMLTGR
jgi:phage-related protein